MKLDNEPQRSILLQIIDAMNFQGKDLEKLFALKEAIRTAAVEEAEESINK